jgi:hypothetical protein
MATQTNYLKGGSGAVGFHDQGVAFARKFVIDTEKNPLLTGAGNIEKLMTVPADTIIEHVTLKVTEAEGAAALVSVGDYLEATDALVDADGFVGVEGNVNAVATVKGAGAYIAAGAYRLYDAADHFIGFSTDADLDLAKFEITVVGRQLANA